MQRLLRRFCTAPRAYADLRPVAQGTIPEEAGRVLVAPHPRPVSVVAPRRLVWASLAAVLSGCGPVAADRSSGEEAPDDVVVLEWPQATPRMGDILCDTAERVARRTADRIEQIVFWADPRLHAPNTFFLPTARCGGPDAGGRTRVLPGDLVGIVLMGDDWARTPTDVGGEYDVRGTVLATLLEETGHGWGVLVSTPAELAARGAVLRERDDPHWSACVDTGGSPLGGRSWVETEPGTFWASQVRRVRFSDFDLYAMGAIPAVRVSPMRVIAPSSGPEACARIAQRETTMLRGAALQVRLGEVLAGQEPRRAGRTVPIRQAWVYLAPAGARPDQSAYRTLIELRRQWPRVFHAAARGTASVIAN